LLIFGNIQIPKSKKNVFNTTISITTVIEYSKWALKNALQYFLKYQNQITSINRFKNIFLQ